MLVEPVPPLLAPAPVPAPAPTAPAPDAKPEPPPAAAAAAALVCGGVCWCAEAELFNGCGLTGGWSFPGTYWPMKEPSSVN